MAIIATVYVAVLPETGKIAATRAPARDWLQLFQSLKCPVYARGLGQPVPPGHEWGRPPGATPSL